MKLYSETDETLAQIDNVQYFFDVDEETTSGNPDTSRIERILNEPTC